MKKIIYLFFLASFFLFSCQVKEELMVEKIDLVGSPINNVPNRIDSFIIENFVKPYNVQIFYKWEDREFDQSRNLVPVDTQRVIPILRMIKEVWLDNYVRLAGKDFGRRLFPKLIVISGGKNYNQNGTITQGQAEAAKKVTLFQANEFNLGTDQGRDMARRYLHILQHEFGHALSQSKQYDVKAYEEITPSVYRADWYNLGLKAAQVLGAITPYATANYEEDYAEMLSTMLTTSNKEFNDMIASNTTTGIPLKAHQDMKAKEKLIVDYFLSAWNISLYALQDSMYKYTQLYLNTKQ